MPLARLIETAGSEILAGADCVVPVPLYPWRRMQRGFNQAADLADALDIPVVHALWRVAFADAELASNEEYLVRKVAEQIELSTADLVETKLRAREEFLKEDL